MTAVLAGIGAWLPPTIVTNAELADRLGVDDQWIQSRTGIRQRHVVDPGVSTADLAVEAGARALKSAGLDAVDTVLVATTTPDHPMPATAPGVASRLGLGGVAAYDLNAVCAGFLYGLATGAALVTGGIAGSVLVIGADVYSSILDPADRTTAPLFGDGAGAVVLRSGAAAEPGALTAFDLGSDGEGADLITVPGGGARQRSGGVPADPAGMYFTMQGRQVFTSAVTHMADSSRTVLTRLGRTAADVDRFVGHQANARILRAVAGQLDVPEDRVVMNIDRVANTSAASIPLALCDAVTDGTLLPGHFVLLAAFGGGLAWGATALTWPAVTPA
ncbi:beta-ketoacyl-ACP synthase III [Spirilliplanes yamanashiensis]|uniref:Beta-ketoacyl-[acyl-carrier-protein] synthase III n=1 Tax=Spirilliplanes yamanashiensis TaxID=42233 RepID=A0A8J3YDZ9_9ACTN|nr:beta-ketoacyl-ACP synthase III [Spirilliplanes yamanashiensis]MDP9816468.1 3-oxoacyl-[acyl-carrier-protein] synthase-3 [Spirilliplanes yamanashiensis]GIJ05995.1 3-oxoacyl-[acyl-carrier-protein] synthase 3 protein 5 [Spirilliplanes yamanashiensis]